MQRSTPSSLAAGGRGLTSRSEWVSHIDAQASSTPEFVPLPEDVRVRRYQLHLSAASRKRLRRIVLGISIAGLVIGVASKMALNLSPAAAFFAVLVATLGGTAACASFFLEAAPLLQACDEASEQLLDSAPRLRRCCDGRKMRTWVRNLARRGERNLVLLVGAPEGPIKVVGTPFEAFPVTEPPDWLLALDDSQDEVEEPAPPAAETPTTKTATTLELRAQRLARTTLQWLVLLALLGGGGWAAFAVLRVFVIDLITAIRTGKAPQLTCGSGMLMLWLCACGLGFLARELRPQWLATPGGLIRRRAIFRARWKLKLFKRSDCVLLVGPWNVVACGIESFNVGITYFRLESTWCSPVAPPAPEQLVDLE